MVFLVLLVIMGCDTTMVPLGSIKVFAVFGGSTIANTGLQTKLYGQVGLTPGSAVSALPPQDYAIHINDAITAAAKVDLLAAYSFAASIKQDEIFLGGTVDLGGRRLYPGAYKHGNFILRNIYLSKLTLKLSHYRQLPDYHHHGYTYRRSYTGRAGRQPDEFSLHDDHYPNLGGWTFYHTGQWHLPQQYLLAGGYDRYAGSQL